MNRGVQELDAQRGGTTGVSEALRGLAGSRNWYATGALVAVVALYLALGSITVFARPPWESNDEVDHVRNVEAIANGSLYRMSPGSGSEAIQPPLYYLLEAGWQRLLFVPVRIPRPVPAHACQLVLLVGQGPCWQYNHHVGGDAKDARLVDVLRLPGLLLGAAAVLLTAAVARRLSRDPWTPVLAAATLAFIPTFLFDMTGVNNDVLAVGLAALATWLAVVVVTDTDLDERKAVALCAGLGAVLGALVQTKLSNLCLLPAIVVAVWLAATDARSRARLLGVFTGVGVLVAAWWLIRNVNLYGDPLALSATRRYNREHTLTFGSSSAVAGFTLRQIFIVVPPVVWKGFWYSWYGAAWPAWPFAPLWALAAVGLVGLRWARTAIPRHRHILAVLGLFAVGGLASVWVVGVQAWPTQGRWAMIGAPAFACLIALGFERLRGFRLARFALPLLSLAMSLGAVIGDVLLV